MSPISIDFTNAPEPGEHAARADFSDPLDDDWYNVRVLEAEETDTSKTSVGLNLLFSIEKGQNTGDKWRGRYVRDTVWLTEKALGWAREKLETLGVDTSAGRISLNPADLVGRRCAVLTRWQERRNDPTKFEAKVRAYDKVADSGLHTGDDWRTMVEPAKDAAAAVADEDVPF